MFHDLVFIVFRHPLLSQPIQLLEWTKSETEVPTGSIVKRKVSNPETQLAANIPMTLCEVLGGKSDVIQFSRAWQTFVSMCELR